MTDYLSIDELLAVASIAIGHRAEVRDHGLLDSALHRPRSTWYGQDAYPDLDSKAAALLLSLVGNHPFVDGNKRVGWIATGVFYELNGFDLSPPSQDDAFDLVMAIAAGEQDNLEKVAETLRLWRQ